MSSTQSHYRVSFDSTIQRKQVKYSSLLFYQYEIGSTFFTAYNSFSTVVKRQLHIFIKERCLAFGITYYDFTVCVLYVGTKQRLELVCTFPFNWKMQLIKKAKIASTKMVNVFVNLPICNFQFVYALKVCKICIHVYTHTHRLICTVIFAQTVDRDEKLLHVCRFEHFLFNT